MGGNDYQQPEQLPESFTYLDCLIESRSVVNEFVKAMYDLREIRLYKIVAELGSQIGSFRVKTSLLR